jgi:low affinity Fe/Cu permease
MTTAELLYLAIALQVILLIGLFLMQRNFHNLVEILDKNSDNADSMIKLNESIHKNETAAVQEAWRLFEANMKLEQRLERYIDIYGPLTEK